MADFDVDYNFLMNNEDRTRAHAIVPDAPAGAFAISGINSVAFPADFKAIAAIPQDQRDPAVKAFYEKNFFGAWEARLSDDVEERILDSMVNNGPVTGTKFLQEAINAVSGPGTVTVDGAWGPATVTAANDCDQVSLVAAIQQTRKAYYLAIVAAHPNYSEYEAGWLARAAE